MENCSKKRRGYICLFMHWAFLEGFINPAESSTPSGHGAVIGTGLPSFLIHVFLFFFFFFHYKRKKKFNTLFWRQCWKSCCWLREGKPGMLQSMGSQRSDSTERLNNKRRKRKEGAVQLPQLTARRSFPGGTYGLPELRRQRLYRGVHIS